jgi:hypothetical protein
VPDGFLQAKASTMAILNGSRRALGSIKTCIIIPPTPPFCRPRHGLDVAEEELVAVSVIFDGDFGGNAGFSGDVRLDFLSPFEGAFVGRTGRAAVASSQPETVAPAPWPAANGNARPPAEGDFSWTTSTTGDLYTRTGVPRHGKGSSLDRSNQAAPGGSTSGRGPDRSGSDRDTISIYADSDF